MQPSWVQSRNIWWETLLGWLDGSYSKMSCQGLVWTSAPVLGQPGSNTKGRAGLVVSPNVRKRYMCIYSIWHPLTLKLQGVGTCLNMFLALAWEIQEVHNGAREWGDDYAIHWHQRYHFSLVLCGLDLGEFPIFFRVRKSGKCSNFNVIKACDALNIWLLKNKRTYIYISFGCLISSISSLTSPACHLRPCRRQRGEAAEPC